MASLSNHIFVGLAEHGEVNGIAGNFHLDVLHRGAVGEVGGGENGGSDDGDGGDGFQKRFHGGDFLSWMENGHKNSAAASSWTLLG